MILLMKYLIPLLCVILCILYIILRYPRSIEGMRANKFIKGYIHSSEYSITISKIRHYFSNCNNDMLFIINKYPNKSKAFYNKKADKILFNNLILKKKELTRGTLISNDFILNAFRRYYKSHKIQINKFISSLNAKTTNTKDITDFYIDNYNKYYNKKRRTNQKRRSNKKSLNTQTIKHIKSPNLISIYKDNTHISHNKYKNDVLLPQIKFIKQTV